MATSTRSKGPISDINVTPLVDVMMVLLILFMVVAQLDDRQDAAGVPIALPQAATAESLREPLTVAVTASGQFALSGKVASRDEVIGAVRKALLAQPNLEVAVGADRATSHERFVALLDLLRTEGVSRFAIQTDARGGQVAL